MKSWLVIEEAKLTIHDIIFRMKNLILESAITFLVVIDPLALAAFFVAFVGKIKVETQKKIALKAILISAIILISFALVGDYLLKALGISMQAFKIAGGILLLLLAIDMLFARSSGLRSTTQAEDEEAEEKKDISVFPLAIPLIAGPGALTSVILIKDKTSGILFEQMIVILVLIVILIITYVALLLSRKIINFIGFTGVNVIGRLMGIILAALACQFFIDGWTQISF